MIGRRSRAGVVLLVSVAASLGGLLAVTPPASAHPLGNATVNHYDGLQLYPDRLADTAVEDVAEIPTLQRTPLIDANGDGRLSPAEEGAYARRQCSSLAAVDRIAVGGRRVALQVAGAAYTERPGAIGLSVGRLACRLTAAVDLSQPAEVTIEDTWDGAGIGWHELTAVGSGVSLRNSPVPARSISDQLRHYPNDLLSSPLDQRSATLQVVPGGDPSTYGGARGLPTAGAASRFLNGLATTFDQLVGRRHLSLGVGVLAVLLAVVLGAGHAFLPGHGKTIMAAYLVGRRGRLRDVVTVGATVTLTHTAGVLVIGLVLSLSATLAPTVVVQDLSVLSGLIVAGVGLWLLITAVRRRHAAPTVSAELLTLAAATDDQPSRAAPLVHAGAPGARVHAHPGPHEHGDDDHEHAHRHGHGGDHPHPHPHGHGRAPDGFSRTGLVGLGVAGGLVPSPSALLVLLAAVALGRTVLGVVLVLGYGIGMAVALTAAGLLLIRLRGRLGRLAGSRPLRGAERLVRVLPVLTACLVLVVGLGLAVQALTGTV